MYCEFYGMTERPFNVTPDPKFLYLNARYREALASLNYGITQRKGFITLIGEAGTGKTTLLKRLLEDLDPKTKSVFIFNTNVTFEEILEYIFAEFDLAVHNGKKLYMLQRLNTFLLEELRNGGNVALLIDEAQDLDFSVLEDLRLLSNLETAKEKILQIVLSGQPELGQKLSNPMLRQLRQRISINCRLLPLSRDEITEYLQFRLQAAGCPDLKLFSREAEDRVYHFSRGVPRLVNVVCDNALVIGYALGKKRIGADIIDEAAADLMPVELHSDTEAATGERTTQTAMSLPSASSSLGDKWRNRAVMLGLIVLALVVSILAIGRSGLRRGDEISRNGSRLEVIHPGAQNGTAESDTGVAAAAVPQREVPEQPLVANPADVRDPREDALPAARPDNRHAAREVPPPGPVEVARAEAARDPALTARRDPIAPPVAEAERAADTTVPRAAYDDAARERELAAQRETARAQDLAREREARELQEAARLAAEREAAAADGRAAARDAARADLPAPVAVPADRERARDPRPETEIAKVEVPPVPEPPVDVAPKRKDARAAEQANDSNAAEAAKSGVARLDGVALAPVTVRPGDSLSRIAIQKYGQASPVILDLLKLANPGLNDIDVISVGQTIRVPQLSDGFPILNDGSGRYSLLVFSTREAWRAQALRGALRGKGFDAVITNGSLGRGKPMTRVVIQGFSDRDGVMAAGQKLQKLLREDSSIAQLSQ